ncbi:hypothetical protein R1sor_016690 [Riccia sorocarpa]|uniref:CCHC-type domain-containing protein n=1 Tax=Riccia sorocarpa TaxID=122646 RepID=A0ABD3HHR4_9MARC
MTDFISFNMVVGVSGGDQASSHLQRGYQANIPTSDANTRELQNIPDDSPIDWGSDVPNEQLKEAFDALASKSSIQPAANAARMKLDVNTARTAFGMYSKLGVILFAAEEVPSRDKVLEWAKVEIEGKRGIPLKMVREIARKHYLLLLATEQQKITLLQKPPTKMDGKSIMITQWTPAYDYREAAKASKQIWVELPFMDPLLLQQGRKMVEALGPVLFHSTHEANDVRYAHLRACVLRHDTENLPNAIIVDLPWGGHFIQEVKYTRLPDACYKCNHKGHKAFECPNNYQQGRRGKPSAYAGPSKDADLAKQMPTTGHPPVTPGRFKRAWKPKGQQLTPTKVVAASSPKSAALKLANRFSALQQDEVTPLQGELGDSNVRQEHTSSPGLAATIEKSVGGNSGDALNENIVCPLSTIGDVVLSQTHTEIDLNKKTTSASGSVNANKEDDLLEVTQVMSQQSVRQVQPAIDCTQQLLTPVAVHNSPHMPRLQCDCNNITGSPISPLEQMIVAKKRFLTNGQASPHEQALQDEERRTQHKQNRPLQEQPLDTAPHTLLMTQMLKWASVQGAIAQTTNLSGEGLNSSQI